MTQPKVWIVMIEDFGEMYVDQVFDSESKAQEYVDKKNYDRTHYSTGRKRSPSRYLDGYWELYEYGVS